jgi:hypothetical protein
MSRECSYRSIFNECLTEFFPGREKSIKDEIEEYACGKKQFPTPRECGNHNYRIKQLLPENNVIVMFWDHGKIWDFFDVMEPDNSEQLVIFKQKLDEKDK